MAYERKPPRGGSGGKKPFGGSRSGSGGGFKKDFGDRPPRRDSGDDRKPRSRSFDSDRPARSRSADDRPKRDFGDRPPRRDFGDRPPRRDSDDRPKRSFRDDGDRPKRDFGDRPKRDFGDRPPRRDFGDKPKRSFGDRDDRPKRDFGDRPKRDFGDRPPRRDFGDKPKRSFGDRDERPARREYTSERKPRFERNEDAGTMQGHELMLYGVHAVQAALRNTARKITAVWATENGQERLMEAYDEARHPKIQMMEKRDLERKLPDGAVHQGMAIAVEPLTEVFLMDVIAAANLVPDERHVVVILDEVSDPHNVGAVMRSMSAFGAKALIVHKHNAPSVTGTMAKIATGALEFVPMIPVVNISGAMQELKNAGFFVLGLDEKADYPLMSAPVDGHIALVLGAEGEGLREKTRTYCDAIASIPTFGDIKSLNISNAAAIALYAATQKKE